MRSFGALRADYNADAVPKLATFHLQLEFKEIKL